jgi:hypothetical protein
MLMTCQKLLRLTLVFALAIITLPAAALAGPHKGVVGPMQPAVPVEVSGKLLTHEGQPAANRQIHFENRVSGDVFLTKTGPDGSFSFALPPGEYNLREEHGPIIAGYIQTYNTDAINLGTVSEPGQLQHFLESERIAPALIHSPAPITSNVRQGSRIEGASTIPNQAAPH